MDKLVESSERAYDKFFEEVAKIDRLGGQTAKNRAMANAVYVFEDLYKLAYDRGMQAGYTLGHDQGYEIGVTDWVKRNDEKGKESL